MSIFVHVLYIDDQESIDGRVCTPQPDDVIKEYHFYVSDDCEHDMFFVQHCFGLIYDSLKKNGVSFTKHWIWSDECAGNFKLACSFYWLSRLHKETGIRHT